MESFLNLWQHLPSHISPVLFSIGSFQLRYYSLMYLVAFAVVYEIGRASCRERVSSPV